MILKAGMCIRLRLERVVVLIEEHHNRWWDCLIVQATAGASVGVGRKLSAHAEDLLAGQEIVSFGFLLDAPNRVGNYVEYVSGKPRRCVEILSLNQNFPLGSQWYPVP